MKIVSWNVNGIRSIKKKGFSSFVSRYSPDLLCLQEVKLGREQADEEILALPGYDQCFALGTKKGYSGVLTYVRQGTPQDKKQTKTALGIRRYDDEGRTVISEHKDFLLYNLYFPSGTSGDERQAFKYDFLDDFYSHLTQLPKRTRERLVIVGDFNICHKEIDIHHPREAERRQLTGFLPEERAWMDKFEAAGFIDTFRFTNPNKKDQYSWWSYRAASREKNLGWRIDYIWVSRPLAEQIKTAQILNTVTGSDHCPVMVDL